MSKPSKAKQVLFELCDDYFRVSEAAFTMLYHPRASMKYGYDDFLEMREARARREKRERLRELRRRELIKVEKQGKRAFIELTEEGKTEVLRERIIRCDTKRRDGRICVVSFDVPEHIASLRNQFRSLLKAADFRQLHRSVWFSEKDIAQSLKELVSRCDMEKWVSIFLAEEM